MFFTRNYLGLLAAYGGSLIHLLSAEFAATGGKFRTQQNRLRKPQAVRSQEARSPE